MPNTYQDLIYTSAQYAITVVVNSVPFQIVTGQVLDNSHNVETETIWAVGQAQPIGIKTNAESYKGKLEVQLGEWNAILQLAGYTSAIQMNGVIIAVTAYVGAFNMTVSGCVFSSQAINIKAKDKMTVASMDFEGLSIYQ